MPPRGVNTWGVDPLADDGTLRYDMVGYTSHKLPSHHDQFLASINLSRLDSMHRKTKRKWLTHLSKAEAAYRIKLKAQKKGQYTMWSYMGLVDPSKEGIT